ncbi:hypothetical protein GH714_030786 [Hevea brasiliensis]|uniref:S-acyltransferase n=1 Tax=Hevea brasiliensis TaxID=3981 RepID=A0A6A6LFA0_HEVBR|nr:hypothetical protein GH714_030786 [Hevea brasiliensis]
MATSISPPSGSGCCCVSCIGVCFLCVFAPFVGKKLFQYIVMGIYTPLITCVFGLYIWCAAADPADPGVFRSKKYLNIPHDRKHAQQKDSKLGVGGESTSSRHDANASTVAGKYLNKGSEVADATSKVPNTDFEQKNATSGNSSCLLWALFPCALICNFCSSSDESSSQQTSEDGMFYCSLCEVEVFKYSKHCRVCDKCVDRFDHHCRWLNNCIGKRNYRQFFTLMVSALLLLILQWSTGILVLICCFLERKRFSVDISSKLGSSFSLVPFVIVVALCTILAMIATLPLAQLFFFHILLIKKGISTYDYIIALREQEQEQQGVGGQRSPQMSPASSLTGLSSASSFSTFHRGAWCTPPRLFLEDQPSNVKLVAIVASSPESSLDSPDIHPFRVSSSGAEESRRVTGLSVAGAASHSGIPLSRSTSDGYEASGGEDSDRVPSRLVQRSTNWSNLLFRPDQDETVFRLKASSSSSSLANNRKL